MAVRGDRFELDLSSDTEEDGSRPLDDATTGQQPKAASFAFVADVKERSPSSRQTPPRAPQLKSTTTGFPAHKKRTRASAFRQQKEGQMGRDDSSMISARRAGSGDASLAPAGRPPAIDELDRRRIDQENTQRLADMSPEDIEAERKELLANLNPSLVEKLLRRANIDDDAESSAFEPPPPPVAPPSGFSKKTVEDPVPPISTDHDPDAPPAVPPPDLTPVGAVPPPSTIHFPSIPEPPALDPSSPDFLTTLHEKYFPSLPADPSTLAWMAPLPTPSSPADMLSSYSPSQENLSAASIRFDFSGDILPPRAARSLPVTKGLHHHGDAPEAAGYTLPELARLARSAYPAQRCIAYQTLGRALHKLGKGRFGPDGSELVEGLWEEVERGRVVDSLMAEAGTEAQGGGGHVSARSYAIEALWLWRKGGGKRWKAV
ncbi:MAG: hypothetical protein M1832_006264 [Thelocarpon impressellum]|nr:MAG: hypothetical protein M1832_006264 [Thelocarpon impressellum]